ncbi:MAG: DUF4118 domain-containing protein [Lachnospiraceae bacterium]|nr:DUF4118 domain-containing protein [Lachnospiraceae bacterium]
MGEYSESGEHILVCISPSPSNPRVVAAAARLADAFQATLTAIYVKPTNYDALSEEDRRRLQQNIRFAEQNGASVTTIIGNDIPAQVTEYARLCGITKIVMGRSSIKRRYPWSRPPFLRRFAKQIERLGTNFGSCRPIRHLRQQMSNKSGLFTDRIISSMEQIIPNVPDMDIYIIPDSASGFKQQKEKSHITDRMRPTLKESAYTLLLLIVTTGIGLAFTRLGFSESNIITVFILGVLLISVITINPVYSAVGSLLSVLLFNWFFIDPRFSFHTYEAEYAVTFAIMLTSSLITGTLANRMKQNTRQAAGEAFRTKVLLDTNQLLQKAESPAEVIRITARQIITLLNRDVAVYPHIKGDVLKDGEEFLSSLSSKDTCPADSNEKEIAEWVFLNRQSAGFRMEHFEAAKSQYHAICLNGYCYGVISIRLNGIALEPFENSIVISILGECALALENLRNAEEKRQASVIIRNEQLRSNLLRSISHDIRTPLTSISGNASNLLSHYKQLDDTTLEQIFCDIYDESEWLIDLVENLLSISRIENGQMELHLSSEVMSDVIEEALKHVDRSALQHSIRVENTDDILLVNMDAKLIMQVLINLINNAVKNTPPGSEICIQSRQEGTEAVVTVCDNGPGIADSIKPHVFEMFYTGPGTVADGRRGLGLGLALCKSIVESHHGRITLSDNHPTGCCFTVSLPMKEVQNHE